MYGVTASGYLARARTALAAGSPKYLFYAAFELRCCIESRQLEYVAELEKYKNTKIKPWKIGETGKRIRNASYANTIAKVEYKWEDGFIIETFHTPVTDDLIRFAENTLGNLLHSQDVFREPSDPWWETTRNALVDGYRKAWLSCQGDSLVPPLWNPETKSVHPVVLEQSDSNQALFEALPLLVGKTVMVSVRYPSLPPAKWKCDL